MSKFLKVKGFSGIVRDVGSGAILNVNEKEIAQAIEIKQNKRKKAENLKNLQSDVSALKNDMSEIKSLLLKMIEDKNGTNNN